MELLLQLLSGLISLPWWGYVLVTLGLTHITIAAVTIYLHRHQAHRGLDLHPVVSHFFRFWLWMTTGMVTREWVAIHRKHHAKCETGDDPHSPQVYGIRKVLLEGAELYRVAAKDSDMLAKYGHGTPEDWIERNLYSKHSALGITLMAVIDVALFGAFGLTIWAVQMLWIPITAAGIINGIGHFSGYRNFQTEDASTNVLPWGILIGGEELHNNHHAYGSSARLSNKWYEFDIGWFYIRTMGLVGLAHVKKVAPAIKMRLPVPRCDLQTLHAVVANRYDVAARFANSLKHACASELQRLKARGVLIEKNVFRSWLHRDPEALSSNERAKLDEALTTSSDLKTIYTMRQDLANVWKRSTAPKEQLLHYLEEWCTRAERSGIAQLKEFSSQLRRYATA
ncbi:MAG: acyl-CoA desaturase [Betaproteobacteria bacterium]|nr:acyl-CoA desaturase [Betaproteobacteria bacterium]